MTSYPLTDDEAVRLDGFCRAEIQELVEQAKARVAMAGKLAALDPKHASFIADVVAEARSRGRLVFQRMAISSCDVCGQSGGYAKFKRGPRRGRDDWDRPLSISGVNLARRFVVIQRRASLGCCWDCWGKVAPALGDELADVRADIPPEVLRRPSAWRYFEVRRCTACGWEGHEGNMRQRLTLMGDGYYPAGCPACPAENAPFGPSLVQAVTDRFEVVPLPIVRGVEPCRAT